MTTAPPEIKVVIGVDEAGRGCAWGSVFAGAVVLPLELLNDSTMTKEEIFLLRDSKKLSEARRNQARDLIQSRAIAWGIGEATSTEIDQWNILNATFTAMHRAIDACREMLRIRGDAMGVRFAIEEIHIDGNRFRMYVLPDGDVIPHQCVIGGDIVDKSISAGSILAKTARDAHVMEHVSREPELDTKWHMGKHKGYCTKDHIDALATHGIHPLHRKSYAPVKKYLVVG